MRPTSKLTPPDSGRKCYREPGEPRDERPTLLIRPFWRSEEEAAAYLSAVRNHEREVDLEADTIESSMAYIARIAGIVAQGPLGPPARRFPPAHRMNREYLGPRPTITEGNLTFEDRTDAIYDRQPGEDDE